VYRSPCRTNLQSDCFGDRSPNARQAGGIFVRRLEQFSPEDRVLLQSVARLVLSDENGTLSEQLERPALADPIIPLLTPAAHQRANPPSRPAAGVDLNNGLGGFTRDGREYVITLSAIR